MMRFTILFVCTLRGEYLIVAIVVNFTSYATVVDIICRDVSATDTIDVIQYWFCLGQRIETRSNDAIVTKVRERDIGRDLPPCFMKCNQ